MSAPLSFGPDGLKDAELGTGPGGDTGTPKWSCTRYTPVPATFEAVIATARAEGITLYANLAGAVSSWTTLTADGFQLVDFERWKAGVDRWTVAGGASAGLAAAVTAAIADRVIICYGPDEPYHKHYAGSWTPENVNAAGLYEKSLWPGALTVVRADYTNLLAFGTPAAGWTGFDYGWAMYEGHGGNGITMSQHFATQKAGLLTLDLGMVPSLNMLSGGNKNTLDSISPCWDYLNNGASSGLIKGTYSGSAAAGAAFACGTVPVGEDRFMASPAWLRRFADVVYNDADAPPVTGFSAWSTPNVRSTYFSTYANRSDFVAAYEYMIAKFATRTTFNGYRTAKGAGIAPPPATVGIQHIASASAVGTSVTVPAHIAGDYLVFTAFANNLSGTIALPAGKTNILAASGDGVTTRVCYVKATGAGTLSGTFTNATEVAVSVYRGVHPTTPFGTGVVGSNSNANVRFNAVTFTVTDGTSWLFAGGGHNGATNLATVAPVTLSNRTAAGKLATWDSNGPRTDWASVVVATNAIGGSRIVTVEMLADPAGAAPPVNEGPTLAAITDKTVVEGSLLTFTASATDPEGDTIEYSLVSGAQPVPTGAVIDATTGVFTWTPATAPSQVGVYNLRVRATDMTGTNPQFPFDEVEVNITVTELQGNEEIPPEDPGPTIISAYTGGLVSIT